MVAVVVPSPAMSLVFWATALTSLAPMFSNGSAQIDFLADGHAVLGDGRPAEGLVEDDVAAGRPEGDADGVSQLVGAGQQLLTRLVSIEQLFCHLCIISVNESVVT